MKTVLIIVIIVLTIHSIGCNGGKPISDINVQKIGLYDVQGNSGGIAIWIDEGGHGVLQIVEPRRDTKKSLHEKRYDFTLTTDQFNEIKSALAKHDLFSIKSSSRKALPDESHPILMAVTSDKRYVKRLKLSKDTNGEFDSIYSQLLVVVKELKDSQEKNFVSEGIYDWDWIPSGFEKLWQQDLDR